MSMTRFAVAVALLAGLTACGPYTNIPAQYRIVQTAVDNSLTASVVYTTSDAKTTYVIKNPVLKVQTEPGSVGITFTEMSIDYVGAPDTLAPKTLTLDVSFRVESSHYRDDAGKLLPGSGVSEIPIINGRVAQLGDPRNAKGSIGSPISAKVIMKGIDDAGIPQELAFSVPINFYTTSS